jgi:predicted nucleic acid-binding protein
MIIYVESNFILEVALGQEESPSAESILLLAENKSIELVFPGFAISEPFATVTQRDRDRRRLRSSFTEMLRQLQRSEPHKQIVTDLQPVPIILTTIVKTEFDLLQSTVNRLLNVGKSIEIDGPGFRQALIFQRNLGLSPQDSIIYAAVIADLQNRPFQEDKCFISRKWKDFRNPAIKSELESYNCRYAESFGEGLDLL